MDSGNQAWLVILAVVVALLMSSAIRRMISTLASWASLAALLWGIYGAFTEPFEQGIAVLIQWGAIAAVLAFAGRVLSGAQAHSGNGSLRASCKHCGGVRTLACGHELAKLTGMGHCPDCHGSGRKRCPVCS